VRIAGPYPHRRGFRFRVTESPGVHRWAPSAATETEARELAEAYAQGLAARGALTVSALCACYLAHLQTRGNKPASISSAAANLASLSDLHGLHITSITPQRAKDAYRALTQRMAVATHQATLRRWRALWAFAMEEGLAKTNPWLLVRPLGRPRKGKPQLTLDEAQKLSHLAEQERSDEGLAVLLALHMGLRNGEVRGLNVRDFDLGRLLRIQDSKTAAGRRVLEVPDFLRRPLQLRAAGRASDEPLLRNQLGRRPGRNWLGLALVRLCALAGVPSVVPHSLRGLYASLHYEEGIDPNLTARKLGHRSAAVTRSHYATREAQHRGAEKQRAQARRQGRRP
jgi:integrase